MYIGSQVKYPLFVSDLVTLNFLDRFYKNIQISHFMKVRAVGEELLRVNGRIERWTDRQMETNDKTIAVWKFANAPKM